MMFDEEKFNEAVDTLDIVYSIELAKLVYAEQPNLCRILDKAISEIIGLRTQIGLTS